jgi:hypothetical protein
MRSLPLSDNCETLFEKYKGGIALEPLHSREADILKKNFNMIFKWSHFYIPTLYTPVTLSERWTEAKHKNSE